MRLIVKWGSSSRSEDDLKDELSQEVGVNLDILTDEEYNAVSDALDSAEDEGFSKGFDAGFDSAIEVFNETRQQIQENFGESDEQADLQAQIDASIEGTNHNLTEFANAINFIGEEVLGSPEYIGLAERVAYLEGLAGFGTAYSDDGDSQGCNDPQAPGRSSVAV